jgi:hypothetical protein
MTTHDDAVRSCAEAIAETLWPGDPDEAQRTWTDEITSIIRTALADALEDGERLDAILADDGVFYLAISDEIGDRDVGFQSFDRVIRSRQEIDAARKGDAAGGVKGEGR